MYIRGKAVTMFCIYVRSELLIIIMICTVSATSYEVHEQFVKDKSVDTPRIDEVLRALG